MSQEPMMLSQTQSQKYNNDGYLLLPDLIDETTLERLRAVTDEIVAGAVGLTEHSDTLDLEPSHTPERPRVRRIKRPHLVHSFYDELSRYPAILAAITPLLGPDIRLRPAGKINMKSAGYGAPVEWHQDWAFYPHTNDDVLAVGILLDDMTSDNGPLMMLPGSQKGLTFDHHSDGAFCGAIDLEATGLDVSAARPIHASAGSVTIHHARLVHGSAPNLSKQPRRILLYEYTAADAWPLVGMDHFRSIDEFNARIVQGKPTLSPRMVDVPVRMPLPPAPHQGSLYENQRTLRTRYFSH
jgi:phytanoyl-CoA hydroxylase